MKNKEIIKAELLNTINDFYTNYNLPPMKISDNEWQSFLDVIEAHFLVRNKMDEYEHALNIIIRRALYFAKSFNAKEFNIDFIKKAFFDLVAFNIYKDKVNAMQEEVDEKAKKLTKQTTNK